MSVCVARLAAALEATSRLRCELKAVIELRQQIAQFESARLASVARSEVDVATSNKKGRPADQ